MEHMTDRATLQYANADQVTDQLWIGGDLETRDEPWARAQLAELVDAGISDILDARLEYSDRDWVAGIAPDLGYRWLGVDDAGQKMPDAWFETGTAHILARIADGGTVLTHCHMGINRGPSMGFAVMLALGWDPIEALDRIRQVRPIAYVGYAEDALDWWARTNGATRTRRAQLQERLRQWRSTNDLDVAAVIRRIRQTGA